MGEGEKMAKNNEFDDGVYRVEGKLNDRTEDVGEGGVFHAVGVTASLIGGMAMDMQPGETATIQIKRIS